MSADLDRSLQDRVEADLRKIDLPALERWLPSMGERRRPGVIRAAWLFVVTVGVVVLSAALGVALSDLRNRPEPSVGQRTNASPSPTTVVAAGDPMSLGAAPDAGSVVFVDGDVVWEYEGRSGRLTRIGAAAAVTVSARERTYQIADRLFDLTSGTPTGPFSGATAIAASEDRSRIGFLDAEGRLFIVEGERATQHIPDMVFSGLHWSPDGDKLALERLTADSALPGGRIPKELVLLDLRGGTVTSLYRAGVRPDATFRFATWSPDSEIVGVWDIPFASSGDLDGRPLLMIRTADGARWDLGTTLLVRSWLSWSSPHTLAFVEGKGRATIAEKAVRTWSPESGESPVSRAGHVAFSPSFLPGGQALHFVLAPETTYDAQQFAAGLGSGDRQVVRHVLGSDMPTDAAPSTEFAEEAVRVSSDGAWQLVLRRPLRSPVPQAEMWLVSIDGRTQRPLVRLTWAAHAYARTYQIFDNVVWSK